MAQEVCALNFFLTQGWSRPTVRVVDDNVVQDSKIKSLLHSRILGKYSQKRWISGIQSLTSWIDPLRNI